MVASTLCWLFYLTSFRPFKLNLDNAFNIVNSIFLLILYVFCFSFAVLPDQESTHGFNFIKLVLIFSLLNFLFVFLQLLSKVLAICLGTQSKQRISLKPETAKIGIEPEDGSFNRFEEGSVTNG